MKKNNTFEINNSFLEEEESLLSYEYNIPTFGTISPYVKTVSILLGFIFVIGIISNLVSILAILKLEKLKTINLLILNLALADIVYTLGIPLFVTNVFSQSWPFKLIGCQLFFLIDFMGMITGVYTVAALSVERYFEVADKKKRLEKYSDRLKLLIGTLYLISVWIFAFLFSLPMILSIELRESMNNSHTCDTNWTQFTLNVFFAIKFTFIFIIPFSVILISSIKLLLFLKKWRRLAKPVPRIISLLKPTKNEDKISELRVTRVSTTTPVVRIKKDIRKKAIQIVLSIVFLFLVQWTPLWIAELNKALTTDMSTTFEDEENVHKIQSLHLINIVITLISYTNSLSNPMLYMFMTFSFRKFVRDLIVKLKSKDPIIQISV